MVFIAETAAGGGNTLMVTLGYIAFFIVLFYLLLIRPQQKQRKQRQEMMEGLQVGSKIYTIGGILGEISEMGDESYKIKIADGVEIEVLKTSVGGIKKPSDEEAFAPGEFKYDDDDDDDEYEYVYEDDDETTEEEKR